MNYLELIRQFWKLDNAWQFTCCETRLYFYLVETANSLGWANNWTHSDAKTAANVGVSGNTLKTARNRLSQAGLISFKEGGKGHANKTRYQILTPNMIPNLTPKPIPKPQPKVEPLLNKHKLNKTKLNDSSSNELLRGTSQSHAENIDYSGLINFFNEKTNGIFGFIRDPLSDKRKGMIRARIREYGKKTFCDAIIRACESNFLKGSGGRGFTANFDWIIKPTNFEKIISGNYDNNQDQRDNKNAGLTEDFARNIAEGVARAQFEKEQSDRK